MLSRKSSPGQVKSFKDESEKMGVIGHAVQVFGLSEKT
jgi:hypothetical protein